MAAFAKATFDTARYAAARPTYPKQLYDFVFHYHEQGTKARWGTAVDLGCGTGQATTELTPFQKVIGVDPSAKMVEQARQNVSAVALPGQIEFVQSAAETLPFLKDNSVDCIVSAQAAHWFDWTKLWKEAARVLRKDGTMAIWGYSEFRLARHPSMTPLIQAYSQGTNPKISLGPHWERPGRSIVENHLQDIPGPERFVPQSFADFQRIYFTGSHYSDLPSPRPVILRKSMTWNDLLVWLHTFSSLHTFHERYPEDLKHPDGDLAVRFWDMLKDAVGAEQQRAVQDTDEVVIEWPLALLLARRA